jgi:DNA polymerase V
MNEVSQCGASEPFALRVIGDDMSPEFIDGNIVVIDPGGMVKTGSFVIARTGDETVLRQLRIEDNQYYLMALNKAIPESRLRGGLTDIIGVVSQCAGKRRRERKRYDV